MSIENLEPYDMILDDTILVTAISYSFDQVVIEGIPTRGRTKEQILRDKGWLRDWPEYSIRDDENCSVDCCFDKNHDGLCCRFCGGQ